MSSIFPIRSATNISAPENARVIALDEQPADDVIRALSSQTARVILAHVYDDPCTPSDLADATDTSLQNIRYHLDNLLEAGLVEVVDTWYSETGNEMQVYAPTASALVMFAGADTTTADLKSVLTELLGAVGILAVSSLLVQWVAQVLRPVQDNIAGGGQGSIATSIIDTLPPGVLFFAGGIVLLAVFTGWWVYRSA